MNEYLTPQACEARIRAFGPKLAERYKEDLRFATPITWHNNPALLRLAAAYAMDPKNTYGLIDDAVSKAIP
ncbi:MAG: hypothetical protein EOP83_36715 [Verrucomicrobiaceae bacterium]|nr:MAG: hypothetical protein EOP83_36715 [Verrucomicrobiaceae bacterium]